MKQTDEYKLTDGRVISIVTAQMKLLKQVTDFVNRLTDEDTYLTFTGNHISPNDEKKYLIGLLDEIWRKKNFHLWALIDNKVIAITSVRRGGTRDYHVGDIGLMVDRDYRRLGLGKYLLKLIIDQAQKMGIKIVTLSCFSDNLPAISLYKKMGFRVFGKLPNGLYRKNKYSDKIEMFKEI
jgi:RimJ/RimL family protein N-acetyltransferase